MDMAMILEREIRATGFRSCLPAETWIDVVPRGVNRPGPAPEYYGISRPDCRFGDSMNDHAALCELRPIMNGAQGITFRDVAYFQFGIRNAY